jgi:hypothetical protein
MVELEQDAKESSFDFASAVLKSFGAGFWLQAICNTTKAKMPAIIIDFFIIMLK